MSADVPGEVCDIPRNTITKPVFKSPPKIFLAVFENPLALFGKLWYNTKTWRSTQEVEEA